MYEFHHIECKNKFPVSENISGDDIHISNTLFLHCKLRRIMCLKYFLSFSLIQTIDQSKSLNHYRCRNDMHLKQISLICIA